VTGEMHCRTETSSRISVV